MNILVYGQESFALIYLLIVYPKPVLNVLLIFFFTNLWILIS